MDKSMLCHFHFMTCPTVKCTALVQEKRQMPVCSPSCAAAFTPGTPIDSSIPTRFRTDYCVWQNEWDKQEQTVSSFPFLLVLCSVACHNLQQRRGTLLFSVLPRIRKMNLFEPILYTTKVVERKGFHGRLLWRPWASIMTAFLVYTTPSFFLMFYR